MKITHRISLNFDKKKQKQLSKFGINVGTGFETFLIDESHPAWLELEPLLQKWKAVDIVDTKFIKSELNSAEYLELLANWHWGYPQPDDDFGYRDVSYDLSNYSTTSGIGKIQKAPIRIKGEPKWEKKHILQLNWIFDLFFVQPDIWETVFKPFGIKSMSVIDHKTNSTLRNILQLVPQGLVELNMAGYPGTVCPDTRIMKYLPVAKGLFPSIKDSCEMDFVLSKEYFGSGYAANRAVIISASLYKKIVENKLKGVDFIPVGNVQNT